MHRRFEGWGGFGAWVVVGLLWGVTIVGAASIGLFVLPAAMLGAVAATLLVRPWPEAAGVLPGLAVPTVALGVALAGGAAAWSAVGTAMAAGGVALFARRGVAR